MDFDLELSDGMPTDSAEHRGTAAADILLSVFGSEAILCPSIVGQLGAQVTFNQVKLSCDGGY